MFEARLDQGVLLKKLLEVGIICPSIMDILRVAFLQNQAITAARKRQALLLETQKVSYLHFLTARQCGAGNEGPCQ